MSNHRFAPIPIEHLAAELCAAPIGSAIAFQTACTELYPDPRRASGAGAHLWQTLEPRFSSSFPSISIDHLLALRDDIWFGPPNRARTVSMLSFLKRIAQEQLLCQGSVAFPRVPRWFLDARSLGSVERDDVARRNFRWLSFALPSDLLMAAADSTAYGPARIGLMSPLLERRLADRPFVETHLHYNAAIPFDLLWVAMLRRLADTNFHPSQLISPGAELNEGARLAYVLLAAALARYILAYHLVNAQGPLLLTPSTLQQISGNNVSNSFAELRMALIAFGQGNALEQISYESLSEIYASLTNIRNRTIGEEWAARFQGDALCEFFPHPNENSPSPEIQFLRAAFRRLEASDSPRTTPDWFPILFWQVVRTRCIFYRYIVQRPMTAGLTWFVRHYRRFGPAADAIPVRTRVEAALITSGRSRGLQAIELRRGPPKNLNEGLLMNKLLWEVRNDLLQNNEPIEIGAILHFARDRGGGMYSGDSHAHGLRSHADPHFGRFRYAIHYLSHRQSALAIARTLISYPASLFALRGVDVCTDELGVPIWVMAPLVRYVRAVAAFVASRTESYTGKPIQRFGATAHAGEDFVHLLGGLRRIHEAITHFRLQRGDRLGHALALGTDPEAWAENTGPVTLTLEERLFDLAWEWDSYGRWSGSVPGDRIRYLNGTMSSIADCIFNFGSSNSHAISPPEICEFIRLLHNEWALQIAGFPTRLPYVPSSATMAQQMLIRYLTDEDLFLRSQAKTVVEPQHDRKSLRFLHDQLRNEIASLGIVVEVNPSSNMLIGHLPDLDSHPMWRLRPPRHIEKVTPVTVCIGSDDPIVFATTLPDEYQLVADTLTRGGLSDDEARKWVEGARRAGVDARFTIPLTDWPGHWCDIPQTGDPPEHIVPSMP